jgi:hypothetical protein
LRDLFRSAVAVAALLLWAIDGGTQPVLTAEDTLPVVVHEVRVGPDLAYEQYSGSHHRIVLPRLTRFPDANVMKKVNDDLSLEQKRLRNEAADCLAGRRNESFWEESSHVAVLTRDVLSIDNKAWYFCGAYPSNSYDPLTYNLRTGERFDFTHDADQLFVSNIQPSQKLLELYKHHYPADSGDCNRSLIAPDTRLFMHLEPGGLAIIPDLPHVIAACGPQIVVPYNEIRVFVREDNPFRDLVGP